ncbi:MAG: sugar phosphate isomerase/epimerase [Hyphomicrobiaceae bacterium]|nr:sugar phosphate isomerase/epimerase [Hyphomicrobiaceae bacterium]
MRIGLNTDSLGKFTTGEVLEFAAGLGLDTVEFGLGGWSSAPHVDVLGLLASAAERDRFMGLLRERGLGISALNASGNPLHPGGIGAADAQLARDAIELAALLNVDRIVMMSGLPAGAPGDAMPNWITSSWPPEATEMLDWQWRERVIPFWRELVPLASAHGIRLCVENHGRQCVYNTDSYFRLRDAVGPVVGMNFDPSHLIWMGGDPVSAIEVLGSEHIYHFHGKDTRIEAKARINGTLDTQGVMPVETRNWNFVPLGHGLSRRDWLDVVGALAACGYDGVISIENEDYLIEPKAAISESVEALRFCIGETARRRNKSEQAGVSGGSA